MRFDNFLGLRLDAKQLILKNDGKEFATLAFRRELWNYDEYRLPRDDLVLSVL